MALNRMTRNECPLELVLGRINLSTRPINAYAVISRSHRCETSAAENSFVLVKNRFSTTSVETGVNAAKSKGYEMVAA